METKEKKVPLKAEDVPWELITDLINEDKCKIAPLCKERGWNQVEFKALLIEYYGDLIEIRRGRYGGVFRKEVK